MCKQTVHQPGTFVSSSWVTTGATKKNLQLSPGRPSDRRLHNSDLNKLILLLMVQKFLRSPVEVGSLSHYLQFFFYIPGGERRIFDWTINSINDGDRKKGGFDQPRLPGVCWGEVVLFSFGGKWSGWSWFGQKAFHKLKWMRSSVRESFPKKMMNDIFPQIHLLMMVLPNSSKNSPKKKGTQCTQLRLFGENVPFIFRIFPGLWQLIPCWFIPPSQVWASWNRFMNNTPRRWTARTEQKWWFGADDFPKFHGAQSILRWTMLDLSGWRVAVSILRFIFLVILTTFA